MAKWLRKQISDVETNETTNLAYNVMQCMLQQRWPIVKPLKKSLVVVSSSRCSQTKTVIIKLTARISSHSNVAAPCCRLGPRTTSIRKAPQLLSDAQIPNNYVEFILKTSWAKNARTAFLTWVRREEQHQPQSLRTLPKKSFSRQRQSKARNKNISRRVRSSLSTTILICVYACGACVYLMHIWCLMMRYLRYIFVPVSGNEKVFISSMADAITASVRLPKSGPSSRSRHDDKYTWWNHRASLQRRGTRQETLIRIVRFIQIVCDEAICVWMRRTATVIFIRCASVYARSLPMSANASTS